MTKRLQRGLSLLRHRRRLCRLCAVYLRPARLGRDARRQALRRYARRA